MSETDEGMVLLDEASGEYFVVNGVGAIVVARLVDGVSVPDVIVELQSDHPEYSGQVEADVTAFVASLKAAGVTT
ncbi:PqqD family peptide modification chaperone [Knoellia sp. CPCC 206453]|uniref:PqqD family peptide modification chaperone n=1 Tax=Knoellia pratensis TaxID=3404796 RepID=UPI00361A4F5F